MPDELVFMMGKYAARFPTDRFYAENHLWLKPVSSPESSVGQGPPVATGGIHGSPPVGLNSSRLFEVGFTAYSVRLLQDVYFLDWNLDPQTPVRHKQEIGEIESSKALSTLYAPFAGRVLEFNERLLEDPSAINTDNYGQGWLYRFQTGEKPLDPEQYLRVLEDGWEETQRMLKGQLQ